MTRSAHWNLKLSHKGFVLIGVPLLFEVTFVVVLFVLIARADQIALREQHSKDLIAESEQVKNLVLSAATEIVQHTIHRKGVYDDFARFDEISNKLRSQLNLLETLATDNTNQLEAVSRIRRVAQKSLSLLERAKEAFRQGGQENTSIFSALPLYKAQFQITWNELFPEIQRLDELALREVEEENPEKESKSRQIVYNWIYLGVALNCLLALGLAIYFNRTTSSRFAVLMDNNSRLAAERNLNEPLKGNDELANLDRTFHQMAAALAEAIKRERAMTENAAEIICSLNEEARISKINRAVEKVWGYQPEDVLGRRISELVAGGETSNFFLELVQIIQAHSEGTLEGTIHRKDERHSESSWSVSWSTTDEALFCVVHDITQRKQLERLKQDFVNMVSHDLRSPLCSISCTLELLLANVFGPVPDQLKRSVEAANRNSKRLINLVNDLLDVEKMESGKMELHKSDISVSDIVERSIESVRALADDGGVKIVFAQSNLDVYADADRLIQALVNLLSNAIKFSPSGATVQVVIAEPPDSVEFRVVDEGPGIPDEAKEIIFDRFRQLPSGAAQKGSSGLGLAICSAIAEAHGGSIGVDSQLGHGSTFWIRIPAPAVTIEQGISDPGTKASISQS